MNLMNHTYKELRKAKLIKSSRQFSTTYVQRNANWFSHQKHNGSDFCLTTALKCLSVIRAQIDQLEKLTSTQKRTPIDLDNRLLAYVRINLGGGEGPCTYIC